MGWHSPRTWVAGSILTAGQLNEDLKDNMDYLKGYTDAYIAHSAAGAAVHQLAAGVYVAGFRGAAGKWIDAGVGTISNHEDKNMNMDWWGEGTPSFATAYSSTPYVFTENRGPLSYGVTQAIDVQTDKFVLRFYRNGTATNVCSWFAIGS